MRWVRRFALSAAFTTGYVLGARAGRQRYEEIAAWWHGFVNGPFAKEATERGREVLQHAGRGLRGRIHVPTGTDGAWPRAVSTPV